MNAENLPKEDNLKKGDIAMESLNTQISQDITHLAFSDESNYNDGKFRAISVISLKRESHELLANELKKIAENKEVKWNEINGDSKRTKIAINFIDFAIKYANLNRIRIDTLIWDIADYRHKVAKRDDKQNFQKMYYHLLKNIITKRWSSNGYWHLFPDEHTAMDWEILKDFLGLSVNSHLLQEKQQPQLDFIKEIYELKELNIKQISQCNSRDNYFIQLADIFAGIGAFSYKNFHSYRSWKNEESGQQSLFTTNTEDEATKSIKAKSKVLYELDSMSKKYQLGVSLNSSRGLMTRDPQKPINFWLYQSRSIHDQAPTK
ncbi:MAG: DUF3800 domain-containing protein [Gomphosphaeria aponina SAG 52.96 = DSM 107014]|uniref:DUF3800 domain-containing protein n=1 Tax=Gomphosphaeria aponina SAG 52.96 = DSM 107014 TaxID=1521640 RepID=A0A941JT65_9CHRO|nr:DUF3800 domain-containing protein [Gomphosphaeria aponina SAG 52.96 = DSM 107014]